MLTEKWSLPFSWNLEVPSLCSNKTWQMDGRLEKSLEPINPFPWFFRVSLGSHLMTFRNFFRTREQALNDWSRSWFFVWSTWFDTWLCPVLRPEKLIEAALPFSAFSYYECLCLSKTGRKKTGRQQQGWRFTYFLIDSPIMQNFMLAFIETLTFHRWSRPGKIENNCLVVDLKGSTPRFW